MHAGDRLPLIQGPPIEFIKGQWRFLECPLVQRYDLSLQRQGQGQDQGAAEVTVQPKPNQPPPNGVLLGVLAGGMPSGICYINLYTKRPSRR